MKRTRKGMEMSFIVWVIIALLCFGLMLYVYNNLFAGANKGVSSAISETFRVFIYEPLGI